MSLNLLFVAKKNHLFWIWKSPVKTKTDDVAMESSVVYIFLLESNQIFLLTKIFFFSEHWLKINKIN